MLLHVAALHESWARKLGSVLESESVGSRASRRSNASYHTKHVYTQHKLREEELMLSVVQKLRDPVGDDGGATTSFLQTLPLFHSLSLLSLPDGAVKCSVHHYATSAICHDGSLGIVYVCMHVEMMMMVEVYWSYDVAFLT